MAAFAALVVVVIASRVNRPVGATPVVADPVLDRVIDRVVVDMTSPERAAASIEQATGVRVRVDAALPRAKAAAAAARDGRSERSWELRGRRLGTIVDEVAVAHWGGWGATSRVEAGGVVLEPLGAPMRFESRVYDVRDLIDQIGAAEALESSDPGVGPNGCIGVSGAALPQPYDAYRTGSEEVLELIAATITTRVQARGWDVGMFAGRVIVVTTPEGHRAAEDALAMARHATRRAAARGSSWTR